MVESGVSGASSWTHDRTSPTASIASRTPCSSLTSSWARCHAEACRGRTRSRRRGRRTAMPTWSIGGEQRLRGRGMPPAVARRRRADGGRVGSHGSRVVPAGLRSTRREACDLGSSCVDGTGHARFRHRRRRPHPDGAAARLAQGLHRRRPRRHRHQGAPWSGPASPPDQVEYVIMGQVLQAGAGQIPARQAAVKAGIPMTVPALTINKVCLSGPRRDRAGRPAHPRRRVRRRRRRRHGVDDQRAAPAAEVPRGLQVRRRRAASTHGLRRPVRTRSPTRPMGELTERPTTPTRHHPRGAGRVRRALATSGPPRR